MAYVVFTALGVVVGMALVTWARPEPSRDVPFLVKLAALVGAGLGAHLLEALADARGWSDDVLPEGSFSLWGGRTVLGGLLGGFASVELAKRALGVRHATGSSFALPLAVALAFGRLGCLFGGCCAGRPLTPDDALFGLAVPWPLVPAWAAPVLPAMRIPVPAFEVVFHALAALVLARRVRRGVGLTTNFDLYMIAYAALRFALEWLRAAPPLALGLTYYQWLCVALFVPAFAQWRARASSVESAHG